MDYNVYKDEKIQKNINNNDIYDFMLDSFNSNINAYVSITRFPGLLNIHLYDPSIANPIKIIE